MSMNDSQALTDNKNNNNQNLMLVKINLDKCNKCGNCTLACPWYIFQMEDINSIPKIFNQELCISCGHCVAVCSPGAITQINFSKNNIKNINKKLIPSFDQLIELFKSRRSIRKFKNNDVNKELIKKIIEGARFSPSTNNIQSTEFVVVKDKDTIEKIAKITYIYLFRITKIFRYRILNKIFRLINTEKIKSTLDRIPDYKIVLKYFRKNKDLIIHNAPVLLFFHASKDIGFSDVNASLAIQNASLAIHSLGLGSFYAGYVVAACRYDKKISRLINIPKNHQIYGCLAIGYPELQYDNWIDRKHPKIDWI